MAAPAPSDKVKDKEYTNWLKVTLALYYMKLGLHTFIQSEVDCLHRFLVKKIYGGQTVPLSPCTMCDSSHVIKNKFTGVWKFPNQCGSYCDVWLYELLILHTNPKSEKIYWENGHTPSWPFIPWECAKVFMSRGQLPSNTRPAECDSQALLTLLANCRHFHQKLSPQGLGLTHTISTIRNKVMHNPEMKVSDADRVTFIQQIKQLLEDSFSLQLLEDCKAAVNNIDKIDNDSIDVFFNSGLEMTALRAVVEELRQKLGLQEKKYADNVKSLKREFRQLTKRVEDVEKKLELHEESTTKRFEDVTKEFELHGERVEKNIVKLQEVEENVELHGGRLGAVEENVEIHGGRLGAVEENVEMHGGRLDAVEENVEIHEGRLGAVEENVEMHEERLEIHGEILGAFGEIVDMHGERLDAFEQNVVKLQEEIGQRTRENNSCMKGTEGQKRSLCADQDGPTHKRTRQQETPKKRRPESDGLSQLKSQTEDKLDTVRNLGCILTTQAAEAKKLLEEKGSVVIKGNPGEGKTTTALRLIDNEKYRDRRVVVYCPRDWKRVDTDWVDVVVLEDILGKYNFDPGYLQEWMVYLPTILEHVDAGKLQVIITTRTDILSKAYSRLGSLKLFSDHLSLTLSSEHLNSSEKMSILNRELQRHKKDMKEDEKEKCIANFSGLIGFPQCCLLFAGDSNLFHRGPKFFKSPENLFLENIRLLKPELLISLAFLFCHGKIYEEYLSPETMPKSSNDLFMELASRLHVSKEKADITLLRNTYESFCGLYIVKSVSYEIISEVLVKKNCIRFSHATVCEAVGQVLGDHSLEMVVKHGDPEYLYQRTYTADAKDRTSENVFIPESMYSLMAERMVHDIVEKGILKSVVKHSALKQHLFLMKLKEELHKVNRIRDFFFMAEPFQNLVFLDIYAMQGECITFLQCILQNDEDVVKLVYSQFMEVLACTHTKNSSDCCQCIEKQMLLELALYYHHFEIADKLIPMNACYTPVSLCNAARCGDLRRVQTILEYLKSLVFKPECNEAKQALCRAYISGNQDVTEILLQEGITLDSMHVVDVVKHGDINVLMKVVEHLKCHSKWYPHLERKWSEMHDFHFASDAFSEYCIDKLRIRIPCSIALCITYCNEKFDIADYLVKNEVKVSMRMFAGVSAYTSQQVVARVIQELKVTGTWDPHCDLASRTLEHAYGRNNYDVCDLLTQEGVSLTIKNLQGVVQGFQVSLESVNKAIQHFKDTDNWDSRSDDAAKALEFAYSARKYDVCDLLVQEGVSLTMKNLHGVVGNYMSSLETLKKTIQHLKDTHSWDSRCDDASEALAFAYRAQKYDVCDLLVQEGVSLTMKHIPYVILRSLDDVKTAVKQLKDTHSWDSKCEYASLALANAYGKQKYDVCDLLVQNGVLLTMMNLHHVVNSSGVSLEAVKKIIHHLKVTDNWDSRCDDASEALESAYRAQKYDVCDLLVEEGVSLTMKHIPDVIMRSLDSVKTVVKQLKDTDNWEPKCDAASTALQVAYIAQKYDVCDLLVKEGVSPTMRNLHCVVNSLFMSLEDVKKLIQHLKVTDNWDSRCDDASEALADAYKGQQYDVCDLLVQEGVSLTMKHIPYVIFRSLDTVKTVVKQLKDTDNWEPKCEAASKALQEAYSAQKYDVCDLLVKEEVSLTMMNLSGVMQNVSVSLKAVKKTIQHLKVTDNWDFRCDDASEALELAYRAQKYDVCDLLVQEGVSLTMRHIPYANLRSLDSVKTVVKQLKDTDNWEPKCEAASKALQKAYSEQNYDVCELLVQEGVSLMMRNLPRMVETHYVSLEPIKKAMQHLKDTDNWDSRCDDASEALTNAYKAKKYDVCDLLVQEGVSPTMKNLHGVVQCFWVLLEAVKKTIQHLKVTDNWDSRCDDASEALAIAYRAQKYDVRDLLVQEGVSLTMKNLPDVVVGSQVSLKAVKKVLEYLKATDNWDPRCEHASKALENAYIVQKYDVCDLLVHKGVSLTMKNLPGVVYNVSLEPVREKIKHLNKYDVFDLLVQKGVSLTMKDLLRVVGVFQISLVPIKKALQHLKDSDKWEPSCDDASEALANAYSAQMYDVCDLLVQERVSLTMKNLASLVGGFQVSLESVKKALQHLKVTDNWDSRCEHASKALENAYIVQKYDVCDLLVQEGVSLSMKNLPGVVYSVSLESVKKAVQHLNKCDVFHLLVQKGVLLIMKNLPCAVGRFQGSLEAVNKAIQYLKNTDNWDPKCDDASKALANANSEQMCDVCDLLIQEGVQLMF